MCSTYLINHEFGLLRCHWSKRHPHPRHGCNRVGPSQREGSLLSRLHSLYTGRRPTVSARSPRRIWWALRRRRRSRVGGRRRSRLANPSNHRISCPTDRASKLQRVLQMASFYQKAGHFQLQRQGIYFKYANIKNLQSSRKNKQK